MESKKLLPSPCCHYNEGEPNGACCKIGFYQYKNMCHEVGNTHCVMFNAMEKSRTEITVVGLMNDREKNLSYIATSLNEIVEDWEDITDDYLILDIIKQVELLRDTVYKLVQITRGRQDE